MDSNGQVLTNDEVRFTARMSVDHLLQQQGLTVDDVGIAPIVVGTWSPTLAKALAAATGAERAENWPWNTRRDLYTGSVEGAPVSFAWLAIGAPATVMEMEAMIACGAKAFIGLGWAGSLQPDAPVGTLLVPGRCFSEEGTSRHYVKPDTALAPHRALARRLTDAAREEGAACRAGPHWTTDAPYREWISSIERYREQGVYGVDMETSAMYALGCVHDIPVCNLLVVSDELWHTWRPAFRTPALIAATEVAQRVVLRAVAGLDVARL